MGDRRYNFTSMKPLKTLFFSLVIMFYIVASFKHQTWITKYTDFLEATIESGRRGGEGEGRRIIRVEKNCWPGTREDKLSLDRLNWGHWIGFHFGLLRRDKWCLQCLFHIFHIFYGSDKSYFNDLRLICLSEPQRHGVRSCGAPRARAEPHS